MQYAISENIAYCISKKLNNHEKFSYDTTKKFFCTEIFTNVKAISSKFKSVTSLDRIVHSRLTMENCLEDSSENPHSEQNYNSRHRHGLERSKLKMGDTSMASR